MTEPRLPKFIVIGAAKAATTWIAHQLRQRPDVFMPGPEPHYFSRCYSRGDAWYAFACSPATQPAPKIAAQTSVLLPMPLIWLAW